MTQTKRCKGIPQRLGEENKMSLLRAGPCAGCCLVSHLDPSHNPEDCHEPCAVMRTQKEIKELAQGPMAGKVGGVSVQTQGGRGRERQ